MPATLNNRSKMTTGQREREIRQVVALCFEMVAEEDDYVDMMELANRTKLGLSTLYKLRRGGVSLLTRVGTVQALAYACGLRLAFEKTGIYLYLHE